MTVPLEDQRDAVEARLWKCEGYPMWRLIKAVDALPWDIGKDCKVALAHLPEVQSYRYSVRSLEERLAHLENRMKKEVE